jgi:phenylalanyl-tRNA synthetase beta chain
MKVSLDWLAEWVDLPSSVEALEERLTLAGLEIEGVERSGPDLSQIRVGAVLERERHPNADRLSVCRVDLGEGEPRQIVCGAPNVAAGQRVAVALPGVTLPDGNKLKKSKIRDVVSDGMICSERELGLGDAHEGILVLDAATPIGVPLSQVHKSGDVVLDLEITPNRGDWASMLGMAREVRAHFGGPLRIPEHAAPESGPPAQVSIAVDDAEGCHAYVARVVRDVDPSRPTPEWLRRKLEAAGMRSLGVIVDVTNLVLLELGQPLHAFDLEKLRGAQLRVRAAIDGEKLATLDGQTRELASTDLVIADAERPIALAGVMGGAETEVQSATRHILIESAHFDPRRVRRAARRLNLHTEASYRFERGIDPEGLTRAADRAARLISELAGGSIAAGVLEARGSAFERTRAIELETSHPNRLLGIQLSSDEIIALLARVDVVARVSGAGRLHCTVPSHRHDLALPQDLIEEIARLHGYDRIPMTLPVAPLAALTRPAGQMLSERVRDAFVAAGLVELVHFPALTDVDLAALRIPADAPERAPLRILNPLNDRESALRTTLLPGLLATARHNRARQVDALRIFEVGPIFLPGKAGELPHEPLSAAALLLRGEQRGLWDLADRPPIFYEMRGILERLCAELAFTARFQPGNAPYLHPGAALDVLLDGRRIGGIGELHPEVARAFELTGSCAVLELDLAALLRRAPEPRQVTLPSRHPAVRRDVAVLLDRDQAAREVMDAIRASAGQSLAQLEIFDRFEGRGVPDGKVSLAFRLIFQRADRTLTDDEVAKAIEKVRNMLVKRFGGELR